MNDDSLPPDEICRRLGVCRWTLRKWICDPSDPIPFDQVGRKRYFDWAKVLAWRAQYGKGKVAKAVKPEPVRQPRKSKPSKLDLYAFGLEA